MRSLAPGALVLVSIVVGSGCSSAKLELAAAKPELCAGGTDTTDVTATVSLTGGEKKAGIQVNFNLTGDGSFDSDPVNVVTSKTIATDASGQAKVTLYSGRNAGGAATITADFSDDSTGDTGSSALSIPFTATCTGGAPTSSSLKFYCDAFNIGAFRQPTPDLAVPCHVEAATHDGRPVYAEAMEISFLLEAGSMEPVTGDDGHRYFLYHPGGGTRPTPKQDLTPSAALNEPSRYDTTGTPRFPRLGLATLVAVVSGEEAWVDRNGNGVFDKGTDTFEDLAEPFVDMDDSGSRDSDEDFVDSNGDGKYSDANGQWDAHTKIWAVTHILWTGAPVIEQKTGAAVATHYELSGSSTTITAPNSLDVRLYLRDENLNPVAGFDGLGSSDYVDIQSPEGLVTLSQYTVPMKNQRGFTWNADGTIDGPFLKDTPFVTTIATTAGYTGAFTVHFTVNASPGPAGAGYFLDQISEPLTLVVSGQVK
jgi:hypothetical protein